MATEQTSELENFRANVSALAWQRGSRRELAAGAGISDVQLCNILNGRSIPSLVTANAIARAAGVPLEDLQGSETAFRRKYRKQLQPAGGVK